MAGRKGAYNILKSMNMPGVGAQYQKQPSIDGGGQQVPITVTSSIKLQPVKTGSGIQLQQNVGSGKASQQTTNTDHFQHLGSGIRVQMQEPVATNVSSQKVTKIAVQHQQSGQNRTRVQQAAPQQQQQHQRQRQQQQQQQQQQLQQRQHQQQSVPQVSKTSQGTPIKIQHQTMTQMRTSQFEQGTGSPKLTRIQNQKTSQSNATLQQPSNAQFQQTPQTTQQSNQYKSQTQQQFQVSSPQVPQSQTNVQYQQRSQQQQQQPISPNVQYKERGQQQPFASNVQNQQRGQQQPVASNVQNQQRGQQQSAVSNVQYQQRGQQQPAVSNVQYQQRGQQQPSVSNVQYQQNGPQQVSASSGIKDESEMQYQAPAVSRLSRQFQQGRPQPVEYQYQSAVDDVNSNATAMPHQPAQQPTYSQPSSRLQQQQQHPSSGTQYGKGGTVSSPKQPQQQKQSPSFGSQYTGTRQDAVDSPKAGRQQPQQQTAPSYGTQYDSKKTASQPQLVPPFGVLYSPKGKQDAQSALKQGPSLGTDYTGDFGSPKTVRQQPAQQPQAQPGSTFVTQYTQPDAVGSPKPGRPQQQQPQIAPSFGAPKPQWQQQPQAVPSVGTQYTQPASFSSPKPIRQHQQPTSVGSQYSQQLQPSSQRQQQQQQKQQQAVAQQNVLQQPAPSTFGTDYGRGAKKQQPQTTMPSFGVQYTPKPKSAPSQAQDQSKQTIPCQPAAHGVQIPPGSAQKLQYDQPRYAATQSAEQQRQTETGSQGIQQRSSTAQVSKPVAYGQKTAVHFQGGTTGASYQPPQPDGDLGVQFVAKDDSERRAEMERRRQELVRREMDRHLSIEDIKSRVGKLRSDLYSSKDENQELHEELRNLNTILSELKVQYEFSERQKQSLEHVTTEMKDEIHDIKSEESRMKMEMERMQSKNDRLQQDLARAKDTEEELLDTSAENTRMTRELQHVQGEHKRMRKDLARLGADKAELEDNLLDANSSHSKLKMDLDLLNDNIIGLQRSLVAAEGERCVLWDRLEEAHAEKERMMDDLIATAEEFDSI